MEKHDLKIQKIRVFDLVQFAEKNSTGDLGLIVITKEKALNMSSNKCADESDIALILVYHDAQCIGYLGMIPSHVEFHGESRKFYWLSSWYINPQYRGSGVGSMLMNEVKTLGIPFGTIHPLDGAYPKLGFFTVKPLPFFILDFNRLGNLIARKLPSTKNPKKLLANWMRRYLAKSDKVDKRFLLKSTHQIAFQSDVYSNKRLGFYRTIEMINDMLRNPWMKQGKEVSGYHFSYIRPLFKYEAFHVLNDHKKVIGFVVWMISVKNDLTYLRICDMEVSHDDVARFIVRKALEKCESLDLEQLILSEEMRKAQNSRLFTLLSKEYKRHYIFYDTGDKAPYHEPGILHFFDGDQNYY